MARTSNNTSAAVFDWGDTSFTDVVATALIAFWIKVDSWSANYQTFISKDDFPTNAAGFGFQRSNNTDSLQLFSRGTAGMSLGIGTGYSGLGWVHVAAWIQTSPSTVARTYKNGVFQSTTTVIGNPFGNNVDPLTFAGVDSGQAIEGFAVWTPISQADADAISAALALGFDPLAMPLRPIFYAPLIGYGAVESDIMGTAGSATVPSNSTYAPGPHLFRSFTKSSAQPVLVASVIASASNSLAFTSTTTNAVDFVVAASNSVILTIDVDNGDIGVSASSSVAFSVSANASVPHNFLVSASNSMALSSTSIVTRTLVSAARSAFIFTTHTSSYTTPILVSASSSFSMTSTASTLGPIYASASNSFRISSSLLLKQLHVYRVSASNAVALSSSVSVKQNSAIMVSASNSMALSANGSTNQIATASASNSIALTSSAKKTMDLFAGATTSFGFSASPGSNNFFAESASNTVTFTVSAGVATGATEASSSVALSSFAWATVEFPWRRTALTLEPGGGLPHSG